MTGRWLVKNERHHKCKPPSIWWWSSVEPGSEWLCTCNALYRTYMNPNGRVSWSYVYDVKDNS